MYLQQHQFCCLRHRAAARSVPCLWAYSVYCGLLNNIICSFGKCKMQKLLLLHISSYEKQRYYCTLQYHNCATQSDDRLPCLHHCGCHSPASTSSTRVPILYVPFRKRCMMKLSAARGGEPAITASWNTRGGSRCQSVGTHWVVQCQSECGERNQQEYSLEGPGWSGKCQKSAVDIWKCGRSGVCAAVQLPDGDSQGQGEEVVEKDLDAVGVRGTGNWHIHLLIQPASAFHKKSAKINGVTQLTNSLLSNLLLIVRNIQRPFLASQISELFMPINDMAFLSEMASRCAPLHIIFSLCHCPVTRQRRMFG